MSRDILHLRLDSFFAVVEQKKRPNLHGRPVIVAEPKGNTSGVVISASREAKRQGIKEGDSVRHAQRACPGVVIFKADYTSYKLVNEEFLDLLSDFSPMLEPDELGSAYMDVTADRSLGGDPSDICARIMREVAARLDMPLQIGCASNKLIAKIASLVVSDLRPSHYKRLVRVWPEGEANFLSPLPVSVLDAVTGKIEKRLGELGISTIGQLSRVSERAMVSQFGPVGSIIRRQALGIDFTPVKAAYPPEVIISEHTFCSSVEEPAEVEEALVLLANRAVLKLRKRRVLAGEITLTLTCEGQKQILRSAQNDGRVAQHNNAVILRRNDEGSAVVQNAGHNRPGYVVPDAASLGLAVRPNEFVFEYFTFKKPTDSAYSINQALVKMLHSIMKPGMEVSKVQISLSGLTRGESSQLSLIGDSERRGRLNRVTELLVQRFGEDAVFLAAALKPAPDAHLYR